MDRNEFYEQMRKKIERKPAGKHPGRRRAGHKRGKKKQ